MLRYILDSGKVWVTCETPAIEIGQPNDHTPETDSKVPLELAPGGVRRARKSAPNQ